MATVGRLAQRFGLSRSTLLYYDRIGLLSPSDRSAAGYRLYSQADVSRLEKILLFRDVGLPLEAIGSLLAAAPGSVGEALERRLLGIHREIAGLRKQQQVILRLLQEGEAGRRARTLDKAGWVELLRATGLDDRDMERWHAEFERMAPAAHQDFLESLGIDADEIAAIRARSRTEWVPPAPGGLPCEGTGCLTAITTTRSAARKRSPTGWRAGACCRQRPGSPPAPPSGR